MCSSSFQFQTNLPRWSLGDLTPAGAEYYICPDLLPVPARPRLGPPTTATTVPPPAAGSAAKELRELYLGSEGAETGSICCSSAAGTPAPGNQTRSAPAGRQCSCQGGPRVPGEGRHAVRENESVPGKEKVNQPAQSIARGLLE